jgi:hypothetical protein
MSNPKDGKKDFIDKILGTVVYRNEKTGFYITSGPVLMVVLVFVPMGYFMWPHLVNEITGWFS